MHFSPWKHKISKGQTIPSTMAEKPVSTSAIINKYHYDYTYPESQRVVMLNTSSNILLLRQLFLKNAVQLFPIYICYMYNKVKEKAHGPHHSPKQHCLNVTQVFLNRLIHVCHILDINILQIWISCASSLITRNTLAHYGKLKK